MKNQLRLVHVDDDAITLKVLRGLLSNEPGVQYQGGFTTPESALEFINNNETDLIVLDVEMPGNDGLWLANQLKGRNIPIFFLTSHTGHALTAFELEALDYLVKPLSKELVANLLERYRQKTEMRLFKLNDSADSGAAAPAAKNEIVKRIFINTAGETLVVNLNELMYIKASSSYSHFVMHNNVQHVSSRNLKVYADTLEPHPDFLRIHRSFIVNKNFVNSISKKGRTSWLVMKDNEKLEISERLKEEITELLR